MAAMEDKRRSIHEALWLECAQLHWELGAFEYLYAEDQSLTDVLNDTARFFFQRLQPVLWDAMVLRLCRMLDPSSDRKSQNLSLRRLLEWDQSAVPPLISDEQRDVAIKTVKKAEVSGEFARKWRNKRLAHNDLAETIVIPPATNRAADEQASYVTRGTLMEMSTVVEKIAEAIDALSDPAMKSDFGKFNAEILLEHFHC